MSENIEWPQDPPQAGDQITIGNTTFAWNEDPGIWVGFVNATSSSTATGGGLSLGEFAGQSFTGSGTIALDGTGPAWVGISSGSGGGAARVHTVQTTGHGNGGAGAVTYFYLEDVSVLEGLSYSIGAGGAGGFTSGSPNRDDNGDAGGASSLTGGGFNIQLTGGGGTPNAITNGVAGTVTATTGITPLTFSEVNDPATEYWNQFVVVNGVNLQLGSGQLSFPLAPPGGIGQTVATSTSASATGGNGFGGSLRIVYENQTGASSAGSSTTINIGGGGGGGLPLGIETITASGNWVPRIDGPATIILVGGGGSGSAALIRLTSGSSSADTRLNMGGGGAGGCVVHSTTVATSESHAVTIGTGGAVSQFFSTEGGVDGVAGLDSTVTFGSDTLVAGGGGAGTFTGSFFRGTGVGGVGGDATGGNILNLVGGKGSGDTNDSIFASAGGSVGADTPDNSTIAATPHPVAGAPALNYPLFGEGALPGDNSVSAGGGAGGTSRGGTSSATVTSTAADGIMIVIYTT